MQWKMGAKYLVLFGLCFLGGRFVASERVELTSGEKRGELAILIDDFGYCGEGTAEMLDLPIPFTAPLLHRLPCIWKRASPLQ